MPQVLSLRKIRSAHKGSLCLSTFLIAGLSVLALCVSAEGASTAPGVNGTGFSNVTSSSALFYTNVYAHGVPTNYYFQYGTTTSYGFQTSVASAGNGTAPVRVSQIVAGLAPGTTYHFRVVASNQSASANSTDHIFTTAKIPLSFQISGLPDPVAFGSSFSIRGALFGTGAAGRTVALQIDPYPYVSGMKGIGYPEVTDAKGNFSFPVVSLLENAHFRVVTVGGALVISPVLVENVAVRVTFHAHRLHRRHGRYYRFYGTVTPAEIGARVGFQLLRSGSKSVNEGGTVVKKGAGDTSRFSQVVRIRHRGMYSALVLIKDGSHVGGYSAAVRIG